ncbi:hypothetical protein JOD57_001122 [Geodermatophilus bullaregiensis]|uniref:hypothetical protein n=1 Tax=Geodermatophilus bullaregiensis TaxID=1564160 RepID=UPI001959C449|nr:hypothetical protein [Geodermatophilus bullaregiensis]MBM7805285.1 hypothetical protein [Geodermatophilus bullaregiensis]
MTRTRTTRTLLRTAVPVAALATVFATAGTASADPYAHNAYDTDADGHHDAYAFDDSGDGYEDTWAIDRDENGLVEQVAVDTDLDGWADTFAFDSDEDGHVEEVGVDTTVNALPDVWGADTDLDGSIDTLAHDHDDDGYADWSEPAYVTSYEYASVSYVFAEADGWLYWETTVEYGYGLASDDAVADGGIRSLTGEEPAVPAQMEDAEPTGGLVAEALRTLF